MRKSQGKSSKKTSACRISRSEVSSKSARAMGMRHAEPKATNNTAVATRLPVHCRGPLGHRNARAAGTSHPRAASASGATTRGAEPAQVMGATAAMAIAASGARNAAALGFSSVGMSPTIPNASATKAIR